MGQMVVCGFCLIETFSSPPSVFPQTWLNRKPSLFGSGYSYGTHTETCICYSYGSQKISIEFLCNCRLLLIQIIVFTFRRIKRFQWVPFLWARLICVLSATHSRHFNFHDAHVTRLERTVQRLVFAIHTGFLWVCWVSVKVVIKFTNR